VLKRRNRQPNLTRASKAAAIDYIRDYEPVSVGDEIKYARATSRDSYINDTFRVTKADLAYASRARTMPQIIRRTAYIIKKKSNPMKKAKRKRVMRANPASPKFPVNRMVKVRGVQVNKRGVVTKVIIEDKNMGQLKRGKRR
jgi:hypothetical protein